MKGSTKNQLILAIVVSLVIVMIAWYMFLPRQQYYKVYSLQEISFQPDAPPALTFTFGENLDDKQVQGSTAVLKNFVIDSNVTPPQTVGPATNFVNAMLERGGVPFTPVTTLPNTLVSNSTPEGLNKFVGPLSFKGAGEMWFAIPTKSQ